jgi:predicted O-methyltransferase YrrM
MPIDKNDMENLTLVSSTEEENKVIDCLNDSYTRVNEMSTQDRYFLNTMLLRYRPAKVLEVGVSAGGSSVIILNALKAMEQAKLYSIDYLSYWYKNPEKAAGFIVDNYPDLKQRWKMYSGGMATKFIEEISGGIDFVLLDTTHRNPGEILDFLMVLPFLKDDAMIIFHDTQLHALIETHDWCITNCTLMSSIYGEKFIPEYLSKNTGGGVLFPNIGAVKLNKQTRTRLFEIINLLTIRWGHLPPERDRNEVIRYFSKYYDPLLVKYINDVFEFQSTYLLGKIRKRVCESLGNKITV